MCVMGGTGGGKENIDNCQIGTRFEEGMMASRYKFNVAVVRRGRMGRGKRSLPATYADAHSAQKGSTPSRGGGGAGRDEWWWSGSSSMVRRERDNASKSPPAHAAVPCLQRASHPDQPGSRRKGGKEVIYVSNSRGKYYA